MSRFSMVGWLTLHSILAACVLLAQGASVRADVIMFITNYGSSTNSPLAYDTSTHALTTIDSKTHFAGSVVGPDPAIPGQIDLFAANGIAGTSTIYTYSISPSASPSYGPANTFVTGLTGEARGMAYSALNNMIYLTTDDSSYGEVQQITASGVNAGAIGTPISFVSEPSRPFGVTVDSSGVLWIATYPSGLYRYDPSALSPSPTNVLVVPGSLFARDTIAPANFDGGAYTGDIFIADVARNVVEFYNPVTTASGTLPDTSGLLNGAAGIGFNPLTGDLYVTNSNDSTIVEYNTGTAKFQYATNLGPGNGILNGPNDLSFFDAPEPMSASIFVLGGTTMLLRRRKNQSLKSSFAAYTPMHTRN